MSFVTNFQESFTSLYPATLVDESGFNKSEMHLKIYRLKVLLQLIDPPKPL